MVWRSACRSSRREITGAAGDDAEGADAGELSAIDALTGAGEAADGDGFFGTIRLPDSLTQYLPLTHLAFPLRVTQVHGLSSTACSWHAVSLF